MKAFELFSGIGGMHFAFKGSGVDVEVVSALDINTSANKVYAYNFPETKLMQNNVQNLTAELFNKLNIDVISMSPPCQPFTRVGLQKGSDDNRCSALHHILDLLPNLTTVRYIIMENVVGFETSSTRDEVISTLNSSGYRYQEFILCPTQFNIPNSRSRYYLLAKRKPLRFCFDESNDVMYSLPVISEKLNLPAFSDEDCCVRNFLEHSAVSYDLSDKVLLKYSNILDIVNDDSKKTCCFTKAYTHYAEGTGSIYCPKGKEFVDRLYSELKNHEKESPEYLELLKTLKMRYFSPGEIAKLMCFPGDFVFPCDMTLKQKYRLLGNSVNVYVVSVLIKLLFL